ncbi:MAG: hypothetical protein AAFV53_40520 [Myxococcota bacterium]
MESNLIPLIIGLLCCGMLALLVFAGAAFLLYRRSRSNADAASNSEPPSLQQDMDANDSPFASAGRAADAPEPVPAAEPAPPEPAPQPVEEPDPFASAAQSPPTGGSDMPPPLPNDPGSPDLPPDPSMPRSKPRPPAATKSNDLPPPLPNSPLPPALAAAPNRTIVPFDLDEYDEDAATVLFTRPTSDDEDEDA